MNLKRRLSAHTFSDDFGWVGSSVRRILTSKPIVMLLVLAVLYCLVAVVPFYGWFGSPEFRDSTATIEFHKHELGNAYSPSMVDTDSLVSAAKLRGEALHRAKNEPYSMSGLILWPDNDESRALGSVVETRDGWRFYDFHGWVKFTDDPKNCAYKYKNGSHFDLQYRKNENAYYIDTSDEIRVYATPLEKTCLLRFWNVEVYMDANFFGNMIDFLIPDFENSILSCKKVMISDTLLQETNVKINDIADVKLPDELPLSTQGNTLEAELGLFSAIDDGYTVAFYLYRDGELSDPYLAYGHTGSTILVADQNKNPAGTLNVIERARMTENGVEKSWCFETYEEFISICVAQGK